MYKSKHRRPTPADGAYVHRYVRKSGRGKPVLFRELRRGGKTQTGPVNTPSTLVTPKREGPSRVRRERAAAVVQQPARVVLLADAPLDVVRRLRRDVLVA